MKELLKRLQESIELDEHLIQFRIGDEFYELLQDKFGAWKLFTVFGRELKLDTKKFNRMDKEEVENILKQKFPNIDIY